MYRTKTVDTSHYLHVIWRSSTSPCCPAHACMRWALPTSVKGPSPRLSRLAKVSSQPFSRFDLNNTAFHLDWCCVHVHAEVVRDDGAQSPSRGVPAAQFYSRQKAEGRKPALTKGQRRRAGNNDSSEDTEGSTTGRHGRGGQNKTAQQGAGRPSRLGGRGGSREAVPEVRGGTLLLLFQAACTQPAPCRTVAQCHVARSAL